MRILEIIKEASDSVVYAVGDSHAEGLSYAAGIKNYAHGGQPSTATSNFSGNYNGHPTGIENVPKGASIVIAQGCNDAANSLKANLMSKGKTPLVSPSVIADNVAKVVSAAKGAGHKVVFVLFPNGDPSVKPYYGGNYTEKVRQAIRSAVGVPVIDMDGSPLADGVHAVPNAYKSTGAKVLAMIGKGGSAPDSKDDKKSDQSLSPRGTTSSSSSDTGDFVLSIPNGRVGTEVADIQKVLVALGFDIGPNGVDGIRGPYTSGAVKELQSKLGVTVDGDPGPETVGALNKLLAGKPEITSKLTHAKDSDVKASAVQNTPMAALSQDSVTKGKVGKILDLIAKPESGGSYDVMQGGRHVPQILNMTLADLYAYQKRGGAGGETAAAGRYQYMPGTLRDYAKRMGVDWNSQKFDPKFQDELCIYTMRYQCKLDDWLHGKVSDGEFLNLLSRVWAGLPNTTGLSTYQGVGSNKAGVKSQVALNTLSDIKSA